MVDRKLSWMGRCNAIKITAFPRLLYLFQTLPIKVPVLFLLDVSRAFTKFVWNFKRSRDPFKTLYCPRSLGGLSFPDVRLYYHSCHLTRVIHWSRQSGYKQWADIEKSLYPFHYRACHGVYLGDMSTDLPPARGILSTLTLLSHHRQPLISR